MKIGKKMRTSLTTMKRYRSGLVDMFFPRICHVCNQTLVEGEKVLCLDCLINLPRTGIATSDFSELHKRLASPGIPIEKAAGWFYYYRDSQYASLIRDAKYHNRPFLSEWGGKEAARELLPTGFFTGIDLIVPVPMHPLKKLMRGYNQSQLIARAIGEVTGIPVNDCMRVMRYHSTQTRRTATGRITRTEGIYSVKKSTDVSKLAGRHVLLIDDVITTGATILANVKAILQCCPTARVSVMSLALSRLR